MTEIKITVDLGDMANFISEEDLKQGIRNQFACQLKKFFEDNLDKYLSNYMYYQMQSMCNVFLKEHPDMKEKMEQNIIQAICKQDSYFFHLFSVPDKYDREERPGYELAKKLCKEPETIALAKESLKKAMEKHFDSCNLITEMTDSFKTMLENLARKE